MTNRIALLILFVVSAFSIATAQNFEGIVTMTSDKEEGLNATFHLKDHLVLMAMNTKEKNHPPLKMIFDKETGDMTTLTEDGGKKMAIVMNPNNSPFMQGMQNQIEETEDEEDHNMVINVTNETKKKGKYLLTKVTASSDEGSSILWVAKDLKLTWLDLFPTFANVPETQKHLETQKLMGIDGFIMEMYVTDKKGDTMEILADVEEKSLDSSLFEIGADTQVMDMRNIMQFIQEAQGDPEKLKQLEEMMKGMGPK